MSKSKHTTMSEEQVSQWMDGDWDGLNPSDCVAGIADDEALRKKWARYHLIRDVMKSEPVQVNEPLVSSICAAIADEPAYTNITPFAGSGESAGNTTVVASNQGATEEKKRFSTFGTGLTGFALAASVALVTVVGMNVFQGQNATQSDNTIASTDAAATQGINAFSQQVEGVPLPEVELVGNTGAYWVSPQTSERVDNDKRLNMFLSQHLENSPTASREGLMSYSRLVGYDDRTEEK